MPVYTTKSQVVVALAMEKGLRERVRKAAEEDGVSMRVFVEQALEEKLGTRRPAPRAKTRARRGGG